MVVKYGMSELGPIVFGKSEQMMFLGQEISNEKNYSERVASDIDEQVRKLLIHAHDIAEKILKAHKNALKKIADTLIEKEVLEQDDFNAVLKPFKINPSRHSKNRSPPWGMTVRRRGICVAMPAVIL